MPEKDTCDIYCFDAQKVNHIRGLLANKDISRPVQLFKSLADANRAKIAFALCHEKELCVCDVANIIGSSVATASHHLRTLRKQGLVNYRREGKMAFYSLDQEEIRILLSIVFNDPKEVKTIG